MIGVSFNTVEQRFIKLFGLLGLTKSLTVVVALVLSRLDYANSVLTAGLPKRLQSVLNALARLIS